MFLSAPVSINWSEIDRMKMRCLHIILFYCLIMYFMFRVVNNASS